MVRKERVKKPTLARQVAEELIDMQDESDGNKSQDFKLSFTQRAGTKKKVKQNKAFTIFVRTNGGFNLKWRPIIDDQVYIKEVDNHYSVTTDCVGYYKNYPTILIAEGILKSLTRKDLEEIAEGGKYANPQRVIIHNVERAMGQMKMKGRFGGSAIWIILIVGVVLYMVYQALTGQ